jgi:hypothetical protein
MSKNSQDNIILYLSLPLAALIIINSYCGLYMPGTYARETYSWYVQAIGQDIADLFIIAPLLLLTSIYAYSQNKTALLIWGGINIFIFYTYAIYCFGVHFNSLFLVYCFILGLSFYSFVYFLFLCTRGEMETRYPDSLPIKTTAIFLIVIAGLFYLTWLKEIIPAIAGHTVPPSITEGGILTNPVHVLDLSIVLPAFIITAVLLWKKKPLGLVLAPAMLAFCILMSAAISILIFVMKFKGLAGDLSLTIIFDIIALVSTVLLIRVLKSIKGN